MKVLIVASYNKQYFAPFILEQARSLKRHQIQVEFFGIVGTGIKGYLKNLSSLKKKIKEFAPDVIHAHYGLSGLLANLQRKVPVITTFHGSDINEKSVLYLSRIAMWFSAWNIFVSHKNVEMSKQKSKYSLLPCGIDLQDYPLMTQENARKTMHLDLDKKYVLFAGAFANKVKNYPLAKAAIDTLDGVELIELKGYSREEVACLMYASNAFLMTSFTEGSPQVIKEAMACGCPIVSVDVGDVAEVLKGVSGCYISSREKLEIAGKISSLLEDNKRTNGRSKIIELNLENDKIISQLIELYKNVIG